MRGLRAIQAGTLLSSSLMVLGQPPAPTYIPQTKFATGQDVQPVYEGWIRSSDGTFTMVFGYLNRNYKEEIAIPAGPDNKIEPGEPDRGQPTYFLPRRQSFLFRVPVPKDWGEKELIWSITAHGHTEKAYGSLLPQEEITERMIMTRGNLNPGEDDPNRPPSISIEPVLHAAVSNTVSLTALVTDDGLPNPRPAPKPRPGGIPGQTNTAVSARPRGLTVTWLEYRGPAKVLMDNDGPIAVSGGQAVTNARFSLPGVYVLRATASDGALSTRADITIKVD